MTFLFSYNKSLLHNPDCLITAPSTPYNIMPYTEELMGFNWSARKL